ncbi:MAG: IS66 family transposase [Clostridiales bacterium]|nr:IS66 family transposase [Clostridiales bacterium]
MHKEEGLTPERRFQKRLAHIKPLAGKLFKFIEPLSSSMGSLLQCAISYMKNQKMNLMNVFLDGNLVFSNNLAERTIRVVTVGSKCTLGHWRCQSLRDHAFRV